MKIGFLIINFYPYRGGAENNCYYLAKELAKKHEVHVFCSGEEDKEEEIDGIKVHRCKITRKLSYYLTFYPSLTEKLLSYELDVIHSHGIGFIQNDNSLNEYLKRYPNTKTVCTPHGPFMALKNYSIVKKIFKSVYMLKVRKNISKYNIVLKVNPFQDNWMTNDYGIKKENIRFLPNGIPGSALTESNEDDKNSAIKKYDLKDRFVLTYMGRIQKYKGLDQVIMALAEIVKVNNDVLFVAMGKEDSGEISRLIELSRKNDVFENVLFTGSVSDEERNAVFEESNIFLFPSEWEAFGIVMLEAMAKGNAVVSSKTEGGKYLIEEGKNGYLFDYGNVPELTDKLKILMKDETILESIKKNNIEKAKDFLWENIAKDLEKIYLEIVKV